MLFARQVIDAVRSSAADRVVGLRLSCDELAPWAGITPEMAPAIAAELVPARTRLRRRHTRVDLHRREDPSRLPRTDRRQRRGGPGRFHDAVHETSPQVPVVLQGSLVEVGQAEWALGGYDDPARCDAVEMTCAQIADPDLVAKIAADEVDRIRPCTRCNQTCQVRDARNPIVTCIAEPTSGRETEDPDWYVPRRTRATCS